MKVTFQTNNYNSLYNNKQSLKQDNYTSFGASIPNQSGFLNPLKKVGRKSTDFILKHYTAPLYRSGLAKSLAKNTEKLNSIVDHMQVLGSIVVTGMYMGLTLNNDNLDPQKKKTLAVNQFLTFLASTLISYLIDKKLDASWENLTRKYMLKKMPKDEYGHKDTLQMLNEKINKWNENNKKIFNEKVKIGEIDSDIKFKPGVAADYAEKVLKDADLANLLKGMGIMKKLLVFGTIYRFISPVAVTPLANWIGNKFIYSKNEK